jgi:RHS repeat-associated protein
VFAAFTAAKEETFSAFGPWCAETCISASECEGEKPHQGFASKKSALHQGQELCNSTTALGLRAVWSETRIGSRCTGKERDAESGLDNFGFRYFGSSMGRFMSPDEPFYDGDIHDPQKLNLYSYVRNNPLNSIDPDGHRVEICDTNGQNCTSISNDAYATAQQQDQYNHAPTLDQLQRTEGESQNITDSNGNVVGTATRINDENAPVEGITPLGERYLAGYAMGAGVGRALGAAWGAVAGWFGRGAETVGATAGRATFQEILQGAVEESGQATKSGGIAQATKDFEALEGQSQNLGRVQMKELPDGGKAVLRNFSKDGRPTLEYQPASGGSKTQWIRYNP